MKTSTAEAAQGLLELISSPPLTTIPQKRRAEDEMDVDGTGAGRTAVEEVGGSDGGGISCICGYGHDDGFSIGCDVCGAWQHGACFGFFSVKETPDKWLCHRCAPRPVDRDRAHHYQTAVKRKLDRRRQSSPTRHRKTSMLDGASNSGNNNNNKRKRRASVAAPAAASQHAQDEIVDVTDLYVSIDHDDVLDDHTRTRLRSQACDWRGLSALDPVIVDAPPPPAQTHVQPVPCPPTSPSSVRPPSYAVRTREPIPRARFISQFTSTIVPSAAYLSDPLNAYAVHGMPRPFVHLVGQPLNLALDARVSGNDARFVRSGCRPNAVLRPVLCPASKRSKQDETTTGISFGIFALRDLKVNEEIVLGWEWDDGNAIHHLPALLRSPEIFPCVPPPHPSTPLR
ncbi:hypothetical protein K488DRAFT_80307 [Vararia minispora EC-137]|uniref:Uncharacterized protein n=1 Tax=Vararia minispora EC-137 TaxID=1314806 RepID=A0ACB8QBX7_9AGAM|nr:hypothetical protein K488DRAFT_80307 [Vararia minispora EC-137]